MPTFETTDFYLADTTDQTKQLTFNVSGLTTGTLRTLIVPSGIFPTSSSDTVALLGAVQTFTNTCAFTGAVGFGDYVDTSTTRCQINIPAGGMTSGFILRVVDGGGGSGFTVNRLGDVDATKFELADSTDLTKLAKFDCSGISSGTTRTMTVPDSSMIIAGSASALTSGRLPFVTTGGLLTDDASATYSTATGLSIQALNAVCYDDAVVCCNDAIVFY